MFFHTVYKSGQMFLRFCHNSHVWRTDGRTEFSSLDRVCIACSAVQISPDFLSNKTPKNLDKETNFKPPNTSKINA